MLGTAVEMLAAIPSIIFGMWGLFVLVPFMQERVAPWVTESALGRLPLLAPGESFQGGGFSILTAGLVLAVMILPFITAFSRDVLLMVPRVTKEAGYGMGSTTWEVLRKISLRYALSGVVGAIFIGLGRALGETMAVAYLVGGDFLTVPRSLFDPGTTVASLIALQFNEATTKLDVSALIYMGLILFVITMVVPGARPDLAEEGAADDGRPGMSSASPAVTPPMRRGHDGASAGAGGPASALARAPQGRRRPDQGLCLDRGDVRHSGHAAHRVGGRSPRDRRDRPGLLHRAARPWSARRAAASATPSSARW